MVQKKLFTNTSKKSWKNNVSIGGRFESEYAYSIGYKEAADILVDNAVLLNPPVKDRLFYPICFNYRQFIELTLKQLIILCEKFYKKTETLGFEKRKISSFHSKQLVETHSIEKLLNWLIKILEGVSDENFDVSIKSLIIEFHNMDPKSEKFRYPISKKNISAFPLRSFFDLLKLKSGMQNIEDYFIGIDGYIDYYDSIANTMIEEMHYLRQ